MTPYANVGGDSNVAAYESGEDYIRVKFRDGRVYTYTASSVGASNLAKMQAFAKSGIGLNSFIVRKVRTMYASKE